VLKSAYKQYPGLTRHLGIYVGILGVHYFFWEPWNPEPWSNASFPGFFLLALAWHTFKIKNGESYIWFFILITLLFGNYRIRQLRAKEFKPVLELNVPPPADFGCLEKRLWAHMPLRQVVAKASGIMPDNAVVLLKNRFAATYFQLYYPQTPVVTRYLDHSVEYLKNRRHLSKLSIFFYTPPLTSKQIFKRVEEGYPTYLLTDSKKTFKKIEKRLNLKAVRRYYIGNTDYRLYQFGSG
jgi:hypothetical protein